jgi:polyisoprenoid-binding protein YceI
LYGDLTVRDVTKPVTLQGEYLGTQDSPFGDTRVGFSAETEVSRKEWGLEWNMALETGGVLVGDKVKLAIDAEWIKQ